MTVAQKKDIKIIGELKSHLQRKFKTDISEIVLFGSRAKGKATTDSDYDILLILNKEAYNWTYKNQLLDYAYDFQFSKDVFLDVHIISKDEIEHSMRGKQPIIQNAIKNGVYA